MLTQKSTQQAKIIFRCIVPHFHPDIHKILMHVGPYYRISEARADLEKMQGTSQRDLESFDYHISLCEQFDQLVLNLNTFNLPLRRGTEISLQQNQGDHGRYGELRMKITDFKYRFYPMKKCIIAIIFLHPVN